ncbi:MAG TPA: hypothetical protein VMV31_15240 [Terriglobales bacterium]|nr:hypothetical protein [Terriglobales bacterium]
MAHLTHVKVENLEVTGFMSADNVQFIACHFHDCQLLYSGGPMLMQNCQLGKNVVWQIQGTAAIVLESLARAGFLIQIPGEMTTGS